MVAFDSSPIVVSASRYRVGDYNWNDFLAKCAEEQVGKRNMIFFVREKLLIKGTVARVDF